MSAFQVYLIMQATAVQVFLAIVAIVAAFGVLFSFMADGLTSEESARIAWLKWRPRLIAITTVAALLALICPDTKTLAAMVIVPRLSESSTLKGGASELYELAKDALRDAVMDTNTEGN